MFDTARCRLTQSNINDTVRSLNHNYTHYKLIAENINDLLQVLSIEKEVITDIEIKKGTFNDVFLEITGKKIREEA